MLIQGKENTFFYPLNLVSRKIGKALGGIRLQKNPRAG